MCSKLVCMHFASWDNSKEWASSMPKGEEILVSPLHTTPFQHFHPHDDVTSRLFVCSQSHSVTDGVRLRRAGSKCVYSLSVEFNAICSACPVLSSVLRPTPTNFSLFITRAWVGLKFVSNMTCDVSVKIKSRLLYVFFRSIAWKPVFGRQAHLRQRKEPTGAERRATSALA